VQMFVEGLDGGRHFFKCPRAEVIGFKILYSIFFLHCFASYRANSLYCSIKFLKCSVQSPKKTMASLGGLILDQSICMHSTSTTCKTVSLN
jgi:hypothetical protein